MDSTTATNHAQEAYLAYCDGVRQASQGKTITLPKWNELPQEQQKGWINAVGAFTGTGNLSGSPGRSR